MTAARFLTVSLVLCVAVSPAFSQQTGLPGVARPPVAGGVGATGGPPPGGAMTAAPSASGGGTNVAVIDIPYIFKNHPRFKQQMDQFKASVDQFEDEMKVESKKLVQVRDDVMARFKPNSEEFKREEEKMAKAQSDMRIKVEMKKREFLEKEAAIYYQTYKEIEALVGDFAVKNRIGLVLKFNGDEIDPNDRGSVLQGVNRPVVYQKNLDISDLILRAVPPAVATGPRPGPQPGPGPAPRPGVNGLR